jgi:hypothetical protein
MESTRLRAIQQPGNAGALFDSFMRAVGYLPRAFTGDRSMWLWDRDVSRARSREHGMPVVELRDSGQRCDE